MQKGLEEDARKRKDQLVEGESCFRQGERKGKSLR